jgi:hypothetical protein
MEEARHKGWFVWDIARGEVSLKGGVKKTG